MGAEVGVPKELRGKLNRQQWVFCAEYLANPTMDGAIAAKAAGYKNPARAAHVLMNNPRVVEVIELAVEERQKNYTIESSKVLKHLCNALYLDPIDIFENPEPGVWRVKDLRQIPEQVRRCITKIKHRTKHRLDSEGNDVSESFVEVELMDKNQCLSMAMKHLGLIEPDTRVNINVQGDLLVKLLSEASRESGAVIDGNVINRLASGDDISGGGQ